MPVFNDDMLNPYGRMYNQLRQAADPNFTTQTSTPPRPVKPRDLRAGATFSDGTDGTSAVAMGGIGTAAAGAASKTWGGIKKVATGAKNAVSSGGSKVADTFNGLRGTAGAAGMNAQEAFGGGGAFKGGYEIGGQNIDGRWTPKPIPDGSFGKGPGATQTAKDLSKAAKVGGAVRGAAGFLTQGARLAGAGMAAHYSADQVGKALDSAAEGDYGAAAGHGALGAASGYGAYKLGNLAKSVLDFGGKAVKGGDALAGAYRATGRIAPEVVDALGKGAKGGAGGVLAKLATPVMLGGTAYQTWNTGTEDYRKRFGMETADPTLLGDLGVRALGAASDLGNAMTFGAASRLYRDKQEQGSGVVGQSGKPAAAPATPGSLEASLKQTPKILAEAGYDVSPSSAGSPGAEGSITYDPKTKTYSGTNVGADAQIVGGRQSALRGGGGGSVSVVPGYFSGGEDSAAARDARYTQTLRDIQGLRTAEMDQGMPSPGVTVMDTRASVAKPDNRMSDVMGMLTSGKIGLRGAQMMLNHHEANDSRDVNMRGQDMTYGLGMSDQGLRRDLGVMGNRTVLRGQDLDQDYRTMDLSMRGKEAAAQREAAIQTARLAQANADRSYGLQLSAEQRATQDASQKAFFDRADLFATRTGPDGKPFVDPNARNQYLNGVNRQIAERMRALQDAVAKDPNNPQKVSMLREYQANPYGGVNAVDEVNTRALMEVDQLTKEHGKYVQSGSPGGKRIVGEEERWFLPNRYKMSDGSTVPTYAIDKTNPGYFSRWWSGERKDLDITKDISKK